MKRIFASVGNFLLLHFLWILYQIAKSRGLSLLRLENLPPKLPGVPILMVCNHEYYTEGIALNLVQGTRFTPWAKNEAVKGIWRLLLKPILKYTSNENLLEETIEDLKNGANYLITPEGTRNYGIGTRRGSIGLGRIMLTCNPVVVPIGISSDSEQGTIGEILRKKVWTFTAGKPFQVAHPEKTHSLKEIVTLVDEAMLRIVRLLPEHKHGYYTGMPMDRFEYTKDVDVQELIERHATAGKGEK